VVVLVVVGVGCAVLVLFGFVAYVTYMTYVSYVTYLAYMFVGV